MYHGTFAPDILFWPAMSLIYLLHGYDTIRRVTMFAANRYRLYIFTLHRQVQHTSSSIPQAMQKRINRPVHGHTYTSVMPNQQTMSTG